MDFFHSVTYVEEEALNMLSFLCDGDARSALNGLETAVRSKKDVISGDKETVVTVNDVKEALQRSHVQYDRNGNYSQIY